jgi:hypothetical protein
LEGMLCRRHWIEPVETGWPYITRAPKQP